jgi:serine/threonine-protein kinase HipA
MKNERDMEKKRCLYCYQELEADAASEYHTKCSKAFYGTATPPALSIAEKDLEEMAREIVKLRVTIPGVQPKLSLALQENKDDPKKPRLTIVGLWGNYILKPQSNGFKHLPENEDLTMKLAELAGIKTAAHSLIRTANGSLAYITKRFDRIEHGKIPMEDLCQLSELPSSGNNKYNSTMEKAGKVIARNSSTPGLDVQFYFELTLFAFLTGNADMHLKNYSMIKSSDNQYRLSPAYDLLCTALAMPDDKEQMAMPLNGKKNSIKKKDFLEFAFKLKIDASVADKIISRQIGFEKDFDELISLSFLPGEYKKQYSELLHSRIKVMQ